MAAIPRLSLLLRQWSNSPWLLQRVCPLLAFLLYPPLIHVQVTQVFVTFLVRVFSDSPQFVRKEVRRVFSLCYFIFTHPLLSCAYKARGWPETSPGQIHNHLHSLLWMQDTCSKQLHKSSRWPYPGSVVKTRCSRAWSNRKPRVPFPNFNTCQCCRL